MRNKLAQHIEYQDVEEEWKKVQLSFAAHEKFQAVPLGATYLGHGWMGRLPDYKFLKYRYKPCWRRRDAPPLERDNPTEYKHAFLEPCSLFAQTNGRMFDPDSKADELDAAGRAITVPAELADKDSCPRVNSANSWIEEMAGVKIEPRLSVIDCRVEPAKKAMMSGQIDYKPYMSGSLAGTSCYGTFQINLESERHLF
jgi:hypothetical protein